MKTWEDDGSGNAYTIDAQFRSYSSQAESLEDYAQFLQKIFMLVCINQTQLPTRMQPKLLQVPMLRTLHMGQNLID